MSSANAQSPIYNFGPYPYNYHYTLCKILEGIVLIDLLKIKKKKTSLYTLYKILIGFWKS